MNRTQGTRRPEDARHANRWSRSPTRRPVVEPGGMTYLVLITVAAALLAGVLSLPLTMSRVMVAVPDPTVDAQHAGASSLRAPGPHTA